MGNIFKVYMLQEVLYVKHRQVRNAPAALRGGTDPMLYKPTAAELRCDGTRIYEITLGEATS